MASESTAITTTQLTLDPKHGRDEMNLAEFPLFFLGQRIPRDVKTLDYEHQVFDRKKNCFRTRKLKIAASEAFGLPTVRDADVLLAILLIAKQTTNFESPKVIFNRRELVELLGWDDSGHSYRRIEEALAKWTSTSLHFNDDGWWNHDEQEWESEGFNLMTHYKIVKRRRPNEKQRELPLCSCEFSSVFFNNLRSGYIKKLDLSEWFSLRVPTAKQMYRVLDKRFFHRKRLDFDLREFGCEYIGLSRKYEAKDLKRKLKPGIEELVSIGFVEDAPISERYVKGTDGRWRVVFHRGKRKVLDEKPLLGPKAERPASRALIKELTDCGVTPKTARELVEDETIGHERIGKQIEVLGWMRAQDASESPKNPAGWLVKAIREDWEPPVGFQTKAEREASGRRIEERKREKERQRQEAKADEERKLEESRRREREEWHRVQTYLKSLAESAREATIDAALDDERNEFLRQHALKFRNNVDADGELYYQMALRNYILPLIEEVEVG